MWCDCNDYNMSYLLGSPFLMSILSGNSCNGSIIEFEFVGESYTLSPESFRRRQANSSEYCTLLFRADSLHIHVVFRDFLVGHSPCKYSYIAVHDDEDLISRYSTNLLLDHGSICPQFRFTLFCFPLSNTYLVYSSLSLDGIVITFIFRHLIFLLYFEIITCRHVHVLPQDGPGAQSLDTNIQHLLIQRGHHHSLPIVYLIW